MPPVLKNWNYLLSHLIPDVGADRLVELHEKLCLACRDSPSFHEGDSLLLDRITENICSKIVAFYDIPFPINKASIKNVSCEFLKHCELNM